MKEIMSTEEVAEIIGVHIATVRRWLNSGELPGANTPAGWRIARENVMGWLDKYSNAKPRQVEQTQESTTP